MTDKEIMLMMIEKTAKSLRLNGDVLDDKEYNNLVLKIMELSTVLRLRGYK